MRFINWNWSELIQHSWNMSNQFWSIRFKKWQSIWFRVWVRFRSFKTVTFWNCRKNAPNIGFHMIQCISWLYTKIHPVGRVVKWVPFLESFIWINTTWFWIFDDHFSISPSILLHGMTLHHQRFLNDKKLTSPIFLPFADFNIENRWICPIWYSPYHMSHLIWPIWNQRPLQYRIQNQQRWFLFRWLPVSSMAKWKTGPKCPMLLERFESFPTIQTKYDPYRWVMNSDSYEKILHSIEWNLHVWMHCNNLQIFGHDFQNDFHLDIFLSPWTINVRKNGLSLACFWFQRSTDYTSAVHRWPRVDQLWFVDPLLGSWKNPASTTMDAAAGTFSP